jgi:nicotinate (nicotinamide) nucleotide adenylyltransferase
VNMARAAMAAGELDEVWLLVNAVPPHKPDAVPYEHRLAMAEIAVEREAGLRAVDWRGPHTLAGFRELMAQWSQREFVFIVGMDAIAWLDRWDDAISIVNNTSFMIAERQGAKDELAGLRRRLGLELGAALRAEVFAFDECTEASSGRVREALRRGEPPEWLDGRVVEYAGRHGLYN